MYLNQGQFYSLDDTPVQHFSAPPQQQPPRETVQAGWVEVISSPRTIQERREPTNLGEQVFLFLKEENWRRNKVRTNDWVQLMRVYDIIRTALTNRDKEEERRKEDQERRREDQERRRQWGYTTGQPDQMGKTFSRATLDRLYSSQPWRDQGESKRHLAKLEKVGRADREDVEATLKYYHKKQERLEQSKKEERIGEMSSGPVEVRPFDWGCLDRLYPHRAAIKAPKQQEVLVSRLSEYNRQDTMEQDQPHDSEIDSYFRHWQHLHKQVDDPLLHMDPFQAYSLIKAYFLHQAEQIMRVYYSKYGIMTKNIEELLRFHQKHLVGQSWVHPFPHERRLYYLLRRAMDIKEEQYNRTRLHNA